MLSLKHVQSEFVQLMTIAALLLLLASPAAVADPGEGSCDPFVDFEDAMFKPPTNIDMGKTSVEKAVDLICDNLKHKAQ